jgi:hypothetical protein
VARTRQGLVHHPGTILNKANTKRNKAQLIISPPPNKYAPPFLKFANLCLPEPPNTGASAFFGFLGSFALSATMLQLAKTITTMLML